MKNLMKILITISLITLSAYSGVLAWERLPQPEFSQMNFMRTADVEEFNVDYAILWTDSAASLFVVRSLRLWRTHDLRNGKVNNPANIL